MWTTEPEMSVPPRPVPGDQEKARFRWPSSVIVPSTAKRGVKRASLVMTFTTPPMASVPYKVDWGPLRISNRSTVEGWIPFNP